MNIKKLPVINPAERFRKYDNHEIKNHNINLMNEDFIRRDSVWFTDKDRDGDTHLTRLSSMGLHKNLSPYNAYKQGKLVKLPFLGSVFLKDDNLCDRK